MAALLADKKLDHFRQGKKLSDCSKQSGLLSGPKSPHGGDGSPLGRTILGSDIS